MWERATMTLKLMLEKVAGRYGGKTGIVSGDLRLSYAELDKASNKIAHALTGMGIKKGDRVAMLLSNSPDFVITFFGIIKTGATAVPLDPQYKLDELTVLFGDCQPALLVSESPVLEPLIPFLPGFKSIKHIIDINSGCGGEFSSYQEIMAANPMEKLDIEPQPEDIALILYTSGPAFSPRGVMLSHGGLVHEAAIMGDVFRQTEKDVVMLYALPMYHVFGLVAVLLSAIARGSTVVMVPGTGLSISSFMAAIEREKGTMFFGVPYIFALAVDMAEKEGIKSDLSSLRLCSSSADFMPVSLIERFKKLYGHKILDCFALTEAVCHVTCPSPNGSGKLGSVGKALPGWEAKIVADDGREVPRNRPGEIALKGPFMNGYYNNPQATSETIVNGWLHTGDIGKMDEAGNVYITGRKKDIIIVKGQNIHPGDVEAVLYRHPAVAEAAVIGIPDEMRGEVVGAAISLKKGATATEADIKKLCLERLASYKVPKQILFFDSLPRTATGQIDKESLRRKLSIPSPSLRIVASPE
ncbi:MAG: AMP-binding protein [Chloroflexi bacterium]|nr:AMP-binding protein [Chloroflexota bacterium]